MKPCLVSSNYSLYIYIYIYIYAHTHIYTYTYREAWCAAVHGVTKSGHDLVTEQQKYAYTYTYI